MHIIRRRGWNHYPVGVAPDRVHDLRRHGPHDDVVVGVQAMAKQRSGIEVPEPLQGEVEVGVASHGPASPGGGRAGGPGGADFRGRAVGRRGRSADRRDQLVHPFAGVAEPHAGVVAEEQRVLDAGVA